MTNGEHFEELRELAEKKASFHSDAKIERMGSGFHVGYDYRNGSPHYGWNIWRDTTEDNKWEGLYVTDYDDCNNVAMVNHS